MTATIPALSRQRPKLITPESMRSAGSIAIAAVVFLVVQGIFLPMPLGVVLQGAIIGGLTALIALGIALIYRANRIINFAQGDLAAVPTVFAIVLLGAGVPFLLALPIGIASAIVLGPSSSSPSSDASSGRRGSSSPSPPSASPRRWRAWRSSFPSC